MIWQAGGAKSCCLRASVLRPDWTPIPSGAIALSSATGTPTGIPGGWKLMGTGESE